MTRYTRRPKRNRSDKHGNATKFAMGTMLKRMCEQLGHTPRKSYLMPYATHRYFVVVTDCAYCMWAESAVAQPADLDALERQP